MGKIKTVIMGDEKAEEEARKKAVAKRVAKKAAKQTPEASQTLTEKPEEVKSEKPAKTVKSDNTKGKNYLKVKALVDKSKKYPLKEALELVKKSSYSKFDGTVEVIFNVLSKGVRGNVTLPHGTGKTLRIKIADDAFIANPVIDFDLLVAHPSMMPKLAKIAKILGPRGLMPNPKTNTISEKPEELAQSLAKSLSWKSQADFPIIHSIIGKVSFETKKLEENFGALTKSIGKDKIVSVFLKATMGPSVNVAI